MTSSELSVSFCTSIRSGIGSLQVSNGGLGNLASRDNRRDSALGSDIGGGSGLLRNLPLARAAGTVLENCCCRLA